MSQPDIIVSTSTDFAVSRRGRPVAAGRWDDVVRVVAYRRGDGPMGTACLDVELRGGGVVTVDEDSPGWDEFLTDLEAQLSEAVPSASWLAQLAGQTSQSAKVLVFES